MEAKRCRLYLPYLQADNSARFGKILLGPLFMVFGFVKQRMNGGPYRPQSRVGRRIGFDDNNALASNTDHLCQDTLLGGLQHVMQGKAKG